VNVKALICEAYIVEEISIFISYYFEPHLRTRINLIPRHDDGKEVPSSRNLSISSILDDTYQKILWWKDV
jgi:hypothetical protein